MVGLVSLTLRSRKQMALVRLIEDRMLSRFKLKRAGALLYVSLSLVKQTTVIINRLTNRSRNRAVNFVICD